jgi:polyphenol oxidase
MVLHRQETPSRYHRFVPDRQTKSNQLRVIRAPHLEKLSWLVHGFSTRTGGFSSVYGKHSLNLGFTKEDSRAVVERNRAAFLGQVGAETKDAAKRPKKVWKPWPLITLRQIHSDIVHLIDSPTESSLVGDGVITSTPGVFLAIQTADCLPVMLVDSKRRAVGVFHAGWRGTFKRIVEKGVGEMRRFFNSDPGDLRAAIGPGIHSCCYQVGEEVREMFESQFAYAGTLFHDVKESDPVREKYPLLFLTARAPGHSELPKKIFLDLVKANRQQLLSVGVPAKNIEASDLCTNCRTDLLFSFRAEKGKTGRMMGGVGIRNKK